MEILFLSIGAILGCIIGFLLGKKNTLQLPETNTSDLQNLIIEKARLEEQVISLSKTIETINSAQKEYVNKYEYLLGNNHELKNKNNMLNERLATQKDELNGLQEKFSKEFENIANKILKENSSEFSKANEKQIGTILNPLREKIDGFQKRIEDNSEKNRLSNEALKQQIIGLKELNEQMSKDAVNLTKALKGDSKTQGNWGEVQLEKILLKAGLEKNIHYRREEVHKGEEGNILRPDYIINLPENKNLIVDSKVSLTAYNNFFNTESEIDQQKFLKEHILSVNNHIKLLGDKNYQNIHQIDQPDYVLMFLANEPALSLALKHDQSLFEKALEKNIVLVSTSTLLATLRTISYIWKTDSQNKNAKEIAERAGKLYEQFKRFTDDLIKVGEQLNNSKGSYDSAMKRLGEGKGNIIGRIEKLKKLGADTNQSVNSTLTESSEGEENTID
jgi:DNA recombination protein RmuC